MDALRKTETELQTEVRKIDERCAELRLGPEEAPVARRRRSSCCPEGQGGQKISLPYYGDYGLDRRLRRRALRFETPGEAVALAAQGVVSGSPR